MLPEPTPTTLLSLPPEIRNVIYLHIFSYPTTPDTAAIPSHASSSSSTTITTTADDDAPTTLTPSLEDDPRSSHRDLRILQTCKHIYSEASLLAFSHTTFHLSSASAVLPACFAASLAPLSAAQVAALRHLTLAAPIADLSALNEAWAGQPFGHPFLALDSLTLVPRRAPPNAAGGDDDGPRSNSSFPYVLAETLKSLRRVRMVLIREEASWPRHAFSLMYRSLLFRTWKWGGERCGIRFESNEDVHHGGEAGEWIKVWFGEGDEGREAAEELKRLWGEREGDKIIGSFRS